MTDDQIRLYAIARVVVPAETRIRTIAEPISDDSPFPPGILYTLELKTPYKAGPERWFAVHSSSLRPEISDNRLAIEIRAAVGG